VADRPLRPATRRSLGRPLPHQQADRPRAPPEAESISSSDHAIRWGYPVLAPVSRCCPGLRGRLLTCYSPVRHSFFIGIATEWKAFDLHVLGTPPAFVLSQDQTLHRGSRFSPERPLHKPKSHQGRTLSPDDDRCRVPRGVPNACHCFNSLTVGSSVPKHAEPPALAFGSHFSVFKERPGTYRYCRYRCRELRRTASDSGLTPLKRFLRSLPLKSEDPLRREDHINRL
jgi:hypothetical protein